MKRRKKMKIIHWSDFNCPYSYIGLKRLSDAVKELDFDPDWELKAFELEPMLDIKPTAPMIIHHATKFGITPAQAEKEMAEIDEIAKEDGLDINYKGTQLTSSRNAHRLAKYVQKNYPKLSQELIFKIYEANFTKNEIIADIEVLVKLAVSIGLDEDEIRQVLSSNSYDLEVDLDMEDARFNGLNSVPFYILIYGEEQLSVPGAFEKIDFKIALEDLISGEIKYKTFI